MTPHRDSPAITVDEQLEQLFIDNVEVWSTLISSPVLGSGDVSAADYPSAYASGSQSCDASAPARQDTFASAVRARDRVAQWVAAQSFTETRASASPWSFPSAGVLAW